MDQQQSSEINQPNFQDENNLLQTIATPKQSQPTKNKVNTFKTRVFRLLRIYAEKSKDITPLLKSINQDIFYKQPQKVNEIILILINQRNISGEPLKQLCSIYKNMLLFKEKKQSKNTLYAETFVKIIKKMEPSIAIAIIQEMLQIFCTKRKCKLHLDFFFYTVRKMAGFRQSISQKCDELLKNENIRPAQKRQIEKLQSKLNKKNKGVKQEE